MPRSRPLSVALALLAGAASASSASAQVRQVVVAEADSIGVDQAAATTFSELVRSELARQAGFAVVPRSQTPPEPCGDAACGAALAQQTGAHSAVLFGLSQLGARVIVQVTHVDRSGAVFYSDRVTAASLEDLDPLSTRVARAIATGRPLGETATVSTVTDHEAREPVRRQALGTTGVRLGQAIPIAGSLGGSGPMTDLGLFMMLELLEFAAVVDLDFRWTTDRNAQTSAFVFGFDLGGRYFLVPEANHGWYLGGGLGYRSISVTRSDGRDRADGLGGHGEAGIMFFRTSDFHLIAGARLDTNFFSLTGLSTGNRTHSAMVGLALTFKPPHRRWFFF